MDEREMWQWYTLITEGKRKAIVGTFQGAMEYGLTRSPHKLPDAAKDAVRQAYAAHRAHVAELEAKYPAQ